MLKVKSVVVAPSSNEEYEEATEDVLLHTQAFEELTETGPAEVCPVVVASVVVLWDDDFTVTNCISHGPH
jgi:hypothetical protein